MVRHVLPKKILNRSSSFTRCKNTKKCIFTIRSVYFELSKKMSSFLVLFYFV